MAILKHISSKSANYGRAMEYLMYEQDRLTNRSRVDEDGDLVIRDNFLIDSLECNVATFDFECEKLNKQYNKNLSNLTTILLALIPGIHLKANLLLSRLRI